MQDDQNDASNELISPALAMKIEGRLFQVHEPMIAKEDWVAVNAALINDIGSEKWLRRLVAVLTTSVSLDEMEDATLNPYTVITFAPQLQEPKLSVEEWIEANSRLIKKIGPANWLWRLLEAMEAV